MGQPKYDEKLGLYDRADFYILSVKFFKFFYDLYGCNQLIQIKFIIETVEVELDSKVSSNLIKGPEISALYEKVYDLDNNS